MHVCVYVCVLQGMELPLLFQKNLGWIFSSFLEGEKLIGNRIILRSSKPKLLWFNRFPLPKLLE